MCSELRKNKNKTLDGSTQTEAKRLRNVPTVTWPALTLFVLGKSDVVFTGGVQNPEEGVEVVVAEQIGWWTSTLLGKLQPLQLLHQKLSGILFNTEAAPLSHTRIYGLAPNKRVCDVDESQRQHKGPAGPFHTEVEKSFSTRLVFKVFRTFSE